MQPSYTPGVVFPCGDLEVSEHSVISPSDQSKVRFIIVGAGMSGLCQAIKLRQAGYESITIVERSSDVGGTWLENSYPNCGCDVPSFLYSYSFAPNPNWTQKYARQPEILQYFRHCADRFDVRRHILFETTVKSARWDGATRNWLVELDDGRMLVAEVLISAVGQLNKPQIPIFPGSETFRGVSWHSARWNHLYPIDGKRLVIIGNGASTIQFLPVLAQKAAHVTLFQRSPSWIHPLNNHRYGDWARSMFRNVPLAAKLYRLWIFLMCEWTIIAFREGDVPNRVYRWWLERKMKSILSAALHPKLVPTYAPGCKRILLSSDFLQAIQRPNVTVVTEPIESLHSGGVRTADGAYDADAIIYGTGFEATELLSTIDINGRNGVSLQDAWRNHPKTLWGITTPEFPNLFLLYGPNTNLGHNSIIYMIERQVSYIMQCIKEMARRNVSEIHLKPSAANKCVEFIQSKLRNTVWASGCSNWYRKPDGTIPNNWYTAAFRYGQIIRKPDFDSFEMK